MLKKTSMVLWLLLIFLYNLVLGPAHTERTKPLRPAQNIFLQAAQNEFYSHESNKTKLSFDEDDVIAFVAIIAN